MLPLLSAALLCGCDSSRHTARPLALIGKQSISRSEVQKYLDYTLRFYSWVGGTRSSSRSRCGSSDSSAACARLRQQLLGRLIEERVVLWYARQHHITLNTADVAALDREVATLQDPGGRPAAYSRLGISSSVLRSVLARELLVRRVEDAVAPKSAKVGWSLQVRKITIPAAAGANQHALYRRAVELATYGRPIPPEASARVEWVAPFRLSPEVQRALAAAQPGQYTGPFSQGGGYLVVELLARGNHAYGTPARQALEARFFRSWLRRELQQVRPQCFTASGTETSCPRYNN